MRQELSTPYAFLYRWIIPALLTAGALYSLWHFSIAGEPEVLGVVTGVLWAVVLVIIARLFDRAKRVWVDGDKLLIFDFTQTIEVDLANVERVRQTPFFRPDRITVYFREPTVFGSKVVFFPRYRWLSLPLQHPTVAELEQRIALSRAGR